MVDGTQDLAYLVCALAFFFTGALTPILNRRTDRLLRWNWLGLFAVCQGLYELLSLPALNLLMPGHLEMLRLALLFLASLFLVEFGRTGSLSNKGLASWYWVYIPLTALLILNKMVGRFGPIPILSVVGASLVAWSLWEATKKLPERKEVLSAAGVSVFLFGILTGIFNTAASLNVVLGVPIELVRASLAFFLAICLGRLCQVGLDREPDPRIQMIYRYLSLGNVLGLAFIAVAGLVGCLGVNYLASRAAQEALAKNDMTSQRIQEIVNNEMEKADRLIQLLAVSPQVVDSLNNTNDLIAVNQANLMMDRFSQTEEAYGVCYLMNLNGETIAASNRNQTDSFLGKNYSFRPYFKQAMLGLQGRYFALGVTSKELGYYSSAPVRNDKGALVGVAVIKRVIRTSGDLKNAFDSDSLTFLADPHGIVVMSNQSSYVLHSIWPLQESVSKELIQSKQFGAGPFTAILEQTPVDGQPYEIAKMRLMAKTSPTLMEGWTLFHFGSTQAMSFYRVLGVAVFLTLGIVLIGFYVSWGLTASKAADLVAADLDQNGGYISTRQAEADLRQGELKFQMLANNICLLSEMGDLLQGCRSLEDALPVITLYMDRLFPSLSGGIYLAVSEADRFAPAVAWGKWPPKGQDFGRDDCWALLRRRNYVVDDPSTSLMCRHLSEAYTCGYQCWPIAAQGQIIGLMHLRQNEQLRHPNTVSGPLKEINQQLLSTVIDQIGLALANLKFL